MNPNIRIQKVIEHCKKALDHLEKNQKRLTVGELDFAKDYISSSIHLLIAEIELEEGRF
jgi:hypothetical protein